MRLEGTNALSDAGFSSGRKHMIRASVLAAVLAFAGSVHADTFFQSATGPFDATVCCGSLISNTQFIGASFSISQATRVDAIGGHFNNFEHHTGSGLGGEVFGAIVSLGSNGLPAGSMTSLAGVLAHKVFTPQSGVDSQVSIDVTLQPGQYGLVFGSGLFGASGRSTLTLIQPGAAATSSGDFITLNNSSFSTWGVMDDKPNRYRVFLSGSVVSSVPEPTVYLMLPLGLAMVGLFKRRQLPGSSVARLA